MKAIIITRVSSPGQADADKATLTHQRKKSEAWAIEKGYDPIVLDGDVVSGNAEYEDRPDLQEAVRLYRAGEVAAIVVYSQDRLVRNEALFPFCKAIARAPSGDGIEMEQRLLLDSVDAHRGDAGILQGIEPAAHVSPASAESLLARPQVAAPFTDAATYPGPVQLLGEQGLPDKGAA